MQQMQSMMQQMMQQTHAMMQGQVAVIERIERRLDTHEQQITQMGAQPPPAVEKEEIDGSKQAELEAGDKEAKKVQSLTLVDFAGAKYDGSPDGFITWENTIREKLTTLGVVSCIDNETFQGYDTGGVEVRDGPFLRGLIRNSTDYQTRVGSYITQSLCGTIHTSVKTMERERREKPKDGRITLTAYEIFKKVKEEAHPVLAHESRDEVGKKFRANLLAPKATRVIVDSYITEQQDSWRWLNATGGGEDVMSEHALVHQILTGMETHHAHAAKTLKAAARAQGGTAAGRYSISRLNAALDSQFPKAYSNAEATRTFLAGGPPKCGKCGSKSHSTNSCQSHLACNKCGLKGHEAQECRAAKSARGKQRIAEFREKKKQEQEGQDQADARAKEKTERRRRKHQENKAFMQIGKQIAAQAAQAAGQPQPQALVALGRPAPAPAPPAPHAPAATPFSVHVNPLAQAPHAPQSPKEISAGGVTFQLNRVYFAMTPDGLAMDTTPSTVSKSICGDGLPINVMHAGFNAKAIENVVYGSSDLLTEHRHDPDLSITYTNADAVADLREDHNAFDTLPGVDTAIDTVMLMADAPPINTNAWEMRSFYLDGAASVCCVDDPRCIQGGRLPTASDSTLTLVGTEAPDLIGNLIIKVGQKVVKLPESKCFSRSNANLLSDGHLEELGIVPCRKTASLECDDGTRIPVKRAGRLLQFDTWVYVGHQPETDPDVCMLSKSKITREVMHGRLSHPSDHYLDKTQPLVDGFPEYALKGKRTNCDTCPEGKAHRQSIHRDPDRLPRIFEPGEAVAMDTTKYMPPSIQGGKTMNVVLDRRTRYLTGQLLENKEATTMAKALLSYCIKHGIPGHWYGDGGPEYLAEFVDLCIALHIEIHRSAPETHEQNPVEVYMRIIGQAVRCDMIGSCAPFEFWADCWLNAIDAKNCTYSTGVAEGVTPYKYHRRPDISMRRPFFCKTRVLVHDPGHTYAPRVMHGHYVRLAMGYKAWKVWVPDLKCYVISRHCTFDELPAEMPSPDPAVAALLVDDDAFMDTVITGKGADGAGTVLNNANTSTALPGPPARLDADIASRPDNTGKDGKWKAWEEFRSARDDLYTRAGAYGDHRERLKVIGQEWQNYRKHGVEPPTVSTSTTPHAGGVGIDGDDEDDIPQASSPMLEAGGVQVISPASHEAEGRDSPESLPSLSSPSTTKQPDKVSPPPDAEPAIKKASTPIELKRLKGTSWSTTADVDYNGPRLRSGIKWQGDQVNFITTAADVIKTLGEVDDCITKGHFTEAGWDLVCMLVEDPKSVEQAMNGADADKWRQAIQKELQSLVDLEVYDAISRRDVPKRKKLLMSKIVLKYKVFEKRYKARLVVLGFMQPDSDVGETFAPVAKFTTFRILMAIACQFDLEISSSDVKTAFLNALLSEPIYVVPPRGLDIDPDTVWRLKKCLYGLKGSPHEWNVTLHIWLIEIGLQQSPIDPCLYSAPGLWVLVWVDDALKVGTQEKVDWFEAEFNKRFEGTHTPEVEMFVGIELIRDRAARTLELRQTAYFDKILKRFGFLDSNGEASPMCTSTTISKDDCPKGDPELVKLYKDKNFDVRAAAASLLYGAICTRPDLSFTVKELCKIMSDPGHKHVGPTKRALKYLKRTRTKGLKFTAVAGEILGTYLADMIVAGWVDASYGDEVDTRRSTQGFVAKLLGAAVAWFSQTQKCVTLSTTEAELYALKDAIKEIIYIRSTLDYFGYPQRLPTVMYEDNAAVVATAHNPGKNHGKLKHIAISVRFVQEQQLEMQVVDVTQEASKNQSADIMTKALGAPQHGPMTDDILGYAALKK